MTNTTPKNASTGPVISPGYAPKPRYPLLARKMGYTGTVLLSVTMDIQGTPVMVSIKKSSGHKVLDQSALKIIWQWRFNVKNENNSEKEFEVDIPVKFVLE